MFWAKIIIGILIGAFAIQASFAQSSKLEQALAVCQNASGDSKRLSCYDEVYRRRDEFKGPATTDGEGKWIKQIDVNPLDDSKTVVLVLTADSGASKWGNKVRMVLRCQSNKTEAYINWGEFLGSDSQRVTTRVGEADAKSENWSLSTDSKATFVPGNDIEFIKRLMTANRFVAQTTPYNESPTTAVFDTGGLKDVVPELRTTCGW